MGVAFICARDDNKYKELPSRNANKGKLLAFGAPRSLLANLLSKLLVLITVFPRDAHEPEQ